ncbi:hypothetical protein AURDEDRAFT_180934 [Auricularia subglabra TFB-10046 SS5]|nr:hypothetical protein AURDEDRAFT_180934 [Auricularia subglabra TFB-10046 SS5]
MSADDDGDPQSTLVALASRLASTLRSAPSPVHANAARETVGLLVNRSFRRNMYNSFVSLPPRAIQSVMRQLHPLDRLAVSQTCHRLRCYTLSHPSLWADLTALFDYHRRWYGFLAPRLIGLLAERSVHAPLRLQLDMDIACTFQNEEILTICGKHLWHIVDLSLLFYVQYNRSDDHVVPASVFHQPPSPTYDTHDISSGITLHLYRPAPALEYFEMKMPSTTLLDAKVFSGFAPRLQHCSLSGIRPHLNTSYPTFARLTTFRWEDKALDPTAFATTLLLMPCLLNLQLLCSVFSSDSPDPETAYPTHPSLRNVMIGQMHNGLGQFLDVVSRMPLSHLIVPISIFDGPLTLWQSVTAVYPIITRLLIGLPLAEASVATHTDAAPVTIRIPSTGSAGVGGFLRAHGIFGHLKALAIHEFVLWDENIDFLVAPNLADLRIILASCYYASFYVYYIGVLQGTSRGFWRLPALRNLHLSYHCTGGQEHVRCRCGGVLRIALSDIHHFVTSTLYFAHPRLATLTLSGVDIVDQDAHVWLARLQELFDEVDISPTSQPISADAPRGVWEYMSTRDFCTLFADPLIVSRPPEHPIASLYGARH